MRGSRSFFAFWVSFSHFIPFSPFWANRISYFRASLFKLPLTPQYLYFSLSDICFLFVIPSDRIQTLPQCINKCWEIAMLFFAKYIFSGSPRPHVCFKDVDAGFPPSHRKVCHSFSSTAWLLSPGGSVAAKP